MESSPNAVEHRAPSMAETTVEASWVSRLLPRRRVFSASVEAEYQQRFAAEQAQYLRVACPIGIVTLLNFLLWDWNADPAGIWRSLAIRGAGCVVLAALAGFTFSSAFPRWAFLAVPMAIAFVGALVCWIIFLRPQGYREGVEGLLQVVLFAAGAFRMSVAGAAVAFVAITVLMNALMDVEGASAKLVLDNNMHLNGGVLLGIAYVAIANWRSRQAFSLERQLRIAHDELTESYAQLRQQREERLSWLEGLASFLRHELKNQIVGARSSIAMAMNRIASDSAAPYLARGDRSLRVMERLVQSATEASTIESALMHEERELLNLGSLVTDRADEIAVASGRRIDVVSDGAVALPGNETRLIQLFDKLIGNSVDHSPEGSTIAIRIARDETHIRVEIRNEGRIEGDPSELFEPFYTTRRGTDDHQGLGLFVARTIARFHEGELVARQATSEIVEFAVELPADAAASSVR